MAYLIKKDQLDACMNRISKHIKKAISNIKTMTGATADSAGASGTVPQPAAGDHEKFLRGDGAWATPEGGGSSEIDYMFRQSNTQYSGGDIVFLSSPTGWFLVSENTGITANSALVIAMPTDGDTITDGTVTWTLRKIGSSSGGGDGVSVGIIVPYGGGNTLPPGYLECNGAAVSRSMYPDLFSRIGTKYGAGDGTTTFNLPSHQFAASLVANVYGNGKNLAFTDGSILFGPRTSSTSAVAYTTSAYGKDVGTALTSGTGLTSGKVAGVATKELLGNTPENSGLTAELSTDSNTIYIIKAFNGQTEDSALIDVTQYAQALADLEQAIAAKGSGFNHRDVITTSGSWTAPTSGYYKVTCIGGGGAGGNGSYTGYGGGAGTRGGTSSFGTYLSAQGGHSGGGAGSYGSGGGGAAGDIAVAYIELNANAVISVTVGAGGVHSTSSNSSKIGSNGSGGAAGGTTQAGGQGAISVFGSGNTGSNWTSNDSSRYSPPTGTGGTNGTPYGGGGGGGQNGYLQRYPGFSASGGGNGQAGETVTAALSGGRVPYGGDGGNGAVIIEYFLAE